MNEIWTVSLNLCWLFYLIMVHCVQLYRICYFYFINTKNIIIFRFSKYYNTYVKHLQLNNGIHLNGINSFFRLHINNILVKIILESLWSHMLYRVQQEYLTIYFYFNTLFIILLQNNYCFGQYSTSCVLFEILNKNISILYIFNKKTIRNLKWKKVTIGKLIKSFDWKVFWKNKQ